MTTLPDDECWYVRRSAKSWEVLGPFTAKRIRLMLTMGRLSARSAEATLDGIVWEPITQPPELVPRLLYGGWVWRPEGQGAGR